MSRGGYGRPPKASQFKKGKSGNPKGRPKKAVGISSTDLLDEFLKILNQPITVLQDGKKKTTPKFKAMLEVLVNSALKARPSAVKVVFQLLERVGSFAPPPDHNASQTGVLVVPPTLTHDEWQRQVYAYHYGPNYKNWPDFKPLGSEANAVQEDDENK